MKIFELNIDKLESVLKSVSQAWAGLFNNEAEVRSLTWHNFRVLDKM